MVKIIADRSWRPYIDNKQALSIREAIVVSGLVNQDCLSQGIRKEYSLQIWDQDHQLGYFNLSLGDKHFAFFAQCYQQIGQATCNLTRAQVIALEHQLNQELSAEDSNHKRQLSGSLTRDWQMQQAWRKQRLADLDNQAAMIEKIYQGRQALLDKEADLWAWEDRLKQFSTQPNNKETTNKLVSLASYRQLKADSYLRQKVAPRQTNSDGLETANQQPGIYQWLNQQVLFLVACILVAFISTNYVGNGGEYVLEDIDQRRNLYLELNATYINDIAVARNFDGLNVRFIS
ncbi:hypothetical protein AWM75_00955 [Aerococcus urinaehominis]|uniref:Uncharacterized protein n=1 Tax=Aerococcus urinaehominis TaxID=128944 RepID=A0A109RGA2_9LACT|nr:hypothetical protein [Aerococcus urinaehominis]AMB98648.1 hypothetical protein AWM75_00955 [Aerococcus urinaehominis]SDL96875.1 hypothetical protein SAMN04487985_10351 [Aerococcus urinaehominis]